MTRGGTQKTCVRTAGLPIHRGEHAKPWRKRHARDRPAWPRGRRDRGAGRSDASGEKGNREVTRMREAIREVREESKGVLRGSSGI